MTVLDDPAPVVTGEQITSITQDVWQSFLEMDLEPHPLGHDAPSLDGPTVTGCVGVSGEWNGSVFLEVTADLAQAAAEAMFQADPGSLAPEEVADAWGELTNMVGGNIKSLFPAPSALSVPSVSEGLAQQVFVPGASVLQRVQLIGPDALVRVTVWQA